MIDPGGERRKLLSATFASILARPKSICPAMPRGPAFSFQEPDMADYFTHFSCLLDVGTPENAARALELYNALSAEGASEEPPSEGFPALDPARARRHRTLDAR